MEAFTPFIPLNADDSGIPGAYLNYRVKNPTNQPVTVSIAALIATRPLVRKLGSKGGTATNADQVLGGTARVTETIDNTIPSGEVYIDGKTWTARSEDGDVIARGSMVTIVRMEGVKLFVRKEREEQ